MRKLSLFLIVSINALVLMANNANSTNADQGKSLLKQDRSKNVYTINDANKMKAISVDYAYAQNVLMSLIKANWPKKINEILVENNFQTAQIFYYQQTVLFPDSKTYDLLCQSLTKEGKISILLQIVHSLSTILPHLTDVDVNPVLHELIQKYNYQESLLEAVFQLVKSNKKILENANQKEYYVNLKQLAANILDPDILKELRQWISQDKEKA